MNLCLLGKCVIMKCNEYMYVKNKNKERKNKNKF